MSTLFDTTVSCMALCIAATLAGCATGSSDDDSSGISSDSGSPGYTDDAAPGVDTGGFPGPSNGPDSGSGGETDSGHKADSGGSTGFDSGTSGMSCSEVNGAVGCCANGESYYCSSSSSTVKAETCSGGKVCGWDATTSEYGCVAAPAMADPSGSEPMACGGSVGPVDSGTGVDSSTGTDSGSSGTDSGSAGIPTTCTQAYGTVGCCGPNGENYYCSASSSTVTSKTCTGGKTCGWNSTDGYYACVTGGGPDPSGQNPIACK